MSGISKVPRCSQDTQQNLASSLKPLEPRAAEGAATGACFGVSRLLLIDVEVSRLSGSRVDERDDANAAVSTRICVCSRSAHRRTVLNQACKQL